MAQEAKAQGNAWDTLRLRSGQAADVSSVCGKVEVLDEFRSWADVARKARRRLRRQRTEDWRTLPWKKMQRNVRRLQQRIYQAERRGDWKRARNLQGLRAILHDRGQDGGPSLGWRPAEQPVQKPGLAPRPLSRSNPRRMIPMTRPHTLRSPVIGKLSRGVL